MPKGIRNLNKKVVFWVLVVGMVAVDQYVKIWCLKNMSPGGSINGMPWPGVFELRLTLNSGIAFGMLDGFGPVLAPIAVLIAALGGIYVYKHPKEPMWTHVAMGLLAAGALGNLIDRVSRHQVVDMFHLKAINFPVFNVADICITIAAAMLIIKWSRESKATSTEIETPQVT